MSTESALSRRAVVGMGLSLGVASGCAQGPQTHLGDVRLSRPPVQADLDTLRTAAALPAMGLGASWAKPNPPNPTDLILTSGERQLGSNVPVAINDRWHLGSITKAFTATLAARCVEAGALSWSTNVGDVLGDRLEGLRSEYRAVTVLHLLAHRSGIPAHETDWTALRYPREEADPRASRLAFSAETLREHPAARPGERFIYSNRGYIVLGAMLEQLLGAPWEDQLAQRVLQPLGMAKSGFGAPGSPGKLDEPVGHASWLTTSRTPHPPGSSISDNPAIWGPAGRLHASLPDLLSFLKAHRDKTSLLGAETWTRLHTPPFGGDYALGWFVAPGRLWHDGTNTLFNAKAVVTTDGRVCAASVCNDGDYARSHPALDLALDAATT